MLKIMSDVIRDIFIAQGFEVANNIFLNTRPTKNCIALFDYGGNSPDAMNHERQVNLQIYTKYENNSEEKMMQLYDYLNELHTASFDGVFINYTVGSEPSYLTKEDGCFVWVCSFTFNVKYK